MIITVPDTELRDALGDIPGVDVVVWPMDAAAPHADLDIVVPPYMQQSDALPRLAGVKVGLVQGQSIGYEGVAEMLPAGTSYANAAGVHETSTAELAVALALASQRQLPTFIRAQADGQWTSLFGPSLADRRVMLLGYGGVGKAIAARLAPFEVEIVPVASRARDEDGVHIHSASELPELLPQSDVVIISLPGGAATAHIVDDVFLSALPDDALLVNVGRGSLVDTDALVDHLQRGRLRAALDVTDPEPLPPQHPLWRLDNVIITPHVGGVTTAMKPRIVHLIRTQIDLMRAGDAPLNVVVRT